MQAEFHNLFFTIISIISLIGLLSYYIIFSRIKISSFDIEKSHFNQPVSIVVCAKNEMQNLKDHSPFWLNQRYDDFEIIIVNDESTDGSFEFLYELAANNQHVKVVNIDKSKEEDKDLLLLKGKRYALRKGILEAKNKYLLFTDADCFPKSKYWIQEMTKAFSNHKIEIVLGYSPYLKKASLLNKVIQLETLLTAFHYFGLVNIGFPYMGVGRNIAYKKELFNEYVFIKSNKSVSGDDDLIIQQFANKKNTAYTASLASWVVSIPEQNIYDYIKQKKRHLGAGLHYSLGLKVVLNLFPVLLFLFVSSTCVLIFHFFNLALLLIALHLLVILFLNKSSIFLKK